MSQETDESEPASWWDTGRGWKAFVFAPLAALPVVTLQLGSAGAPGNVTNLVAPIVLALAYAGALLLAAPLYLLLRAFKLTAFWIAPIAGAAVGFAVMLLLLIAIGGTKQAGLVSEAMKYGTPSGAAVGALFWWIARPDRPGAPGDDLVLPKFGWALVKVPIAFLIAPLAIAIGTFVVAYLPGMDVDPLAAYGLALVVSVPLFRILRERGLTGLRTSARAGSALGLAGFVMLVWFVAGPRAPFTAISSVLALLIFALSGAILGAIFWLIARPDRARPGASQAP